MYILGLGGSLHDFSACLLKDGEILTTIEDERITRKKHGINLGVNLSRGYSRNYCLDANGINMSDVGLVVANDIINPCMLYKLNDVKKINHHLAHAASSFFCSPYNKAAILVVDAVGSLDNQGLYETISYYSGEGNRLELIEKKVGVNLSGTDYISNSLGMFYSLITELIGFSELQEGKTMGLAPYGGDSKYRELSSYVDIINGEFLFDLNSIQAIIGKIKEQCNREKNIMHMADYAWAAQKILEEVLLNCCVYLKKITGHNNLCVAGGCFLNSVANYKIYKHKIFDNMFIQPAAGDNGTSIGAAMYGYYTILNNKRCYDI